MNNEKWIELCYLLHENIKSDISENDFEQNVLRALESLNWKEFLGNIQIRPSFQIGANNRIIPDFLIKSNEGKNLFVIEIKQPHIPLNSTFQQQLFSYMRQLKLEYGILIGQSIQLFYDGILSNQENPILLETIKFDRDNAQGIEFINLFNKTNFNESDLEKFTLKAIKRIDKKKDFKTLTQKIISEEFDKTVSSLIKQHFINDYDGELLDAVLKNISIELIDKNQVGTNLPNTTFTNRLSKPNNAKPGIIKSIINILKTPHTQEEVHKKLVKLFPEREPNGMRHTVRCQLGGKNRPVRLEEEQYVKVNIELGSDNEYRYSINHQSNSINKIEKIGPLVQKNFRLLFEQGLLTTSEINNLQKPDYCKRVLNQNFEVLRNINKGVKDEQGRNRYYTREVFCGNYYLTSQWYEYHREAFNNWLKSIKK